MTEGKQGRQGIQGSQGVQGLQGIIGEPGKVQPGTPGPGGVAGPRGPRGGTTYVTSTWIFAMLTLVLVGIVAYQAVAFRSFTDRVCGLSHVAQDFRDAQAESYIQFRDQEKTNKFIDDVLRKKRVDTWQRLADRAAATHGPAVRLCP